MNPKSISHRSFEVSFEREYLEVGQESFEVTGGDRAVFEAECTEKDKARLTGSLGIRVKAVCDRCLDDVEVSLLAEVDEEVETDADIDMDELLYREFLMLWPTKILCREDCRGLCPICGRNLNGGDCSCNREALDPRMAAVLDIFEGKKEV